MASELHSLIEEELRHKNYKSTGNDEEKALIGALRVEARVKEHQHQKKVLTLKRSICIGGGLLVVIVLWVVLALKSKSASRHATGVLQPSVTPTPSSILAGPSVMPPAVQPAVQPAMKPAAQPAASPIGSKSLPKDIGDYSNNYNFPNEAQLDDEVNKNKFQPADSSGDTTASSTGPLPSASAGGNKDSSTTNKADSGGNPAASSPAPSADSTKPSAAGTNSNGRRLAQSHLPLRTLPDNTVL